METLPAGKGIEERIAQEPQEQRIVNPHEQLNPTNFGLFPQLLSAYGQAALSENQDAISTNAREKITDDVVSRALQINKTTKNPYDASTIKISGNGATAIKQYFNMLASITQKHFPDKITDPGYEDEMEVIAKLFTNKEDPKLLGGRLQKYQYRYAETAKDLAEVPVPAEAANVHIAFLNSFANTATAIMEISAYSSSDPMTGVLGMQNYKLEVAHLKTVFRIARDLVRSQHIVFTQNESGYELQAYFDQLK